MHSPVCKPYVSKGPSIQPRKGRTYMHVVEAVVQFTECSAVGHELVNLDLAIEIIFHKSQRQQDLGHQKCTFHKAREFSPAFDASESSSTPGSSSHL